MSENKTQSPKPPRRNPKQHDEMSVLQARVSTALKNVSRVCTSSVIASRLISLSNHVAAEANLNDLRVIPSFRPKDTKDSNLIILATAGRCLQLLDEIRGVSLTQYNLGTKPLLDLGLQYLEFLATAKRENIRVFGNLKDGWYLEDSERGCCPKTLFGADHGTTGRTEPGIKTPVAPRKSVPAGNGSTGSTGDDSETGDVIPGVE